MVRISVSRRPRRRVFSPASDTHYIEEPISKQGMGPECRGWPPKRTVRKEFELKGSDTAVIQRLKKEIETAKHGSCGRISGDEAIFYRARHAEESVTLAIYHGRSRGYRRVQVFRNRATEYRSGKFKDLVPACKALQAARQDKGVRDPAGFVVMGPPSAPRPNGLLWSTRSSETEARGQAVPSPEERNLGNVIRRGFDKSRLVACGGPTLARAGPKKAVREL
jgi:hypothetical protein